ncbi:TRIC cation channel family protein [Actinomycetospora corticicola]|uniref:Putative membrane protein YeiH n=1 Tax=Actinomycetospora corticicola TaxID=663602 RepID=A0A7Y9DY22_9PSEU|nr:putative membrane protein YeiH [Actinomycetospora corticicola]
MPGTVTVQVLLDLIGIAVGAAAGALTAVRFRMHYMGCLLLGLVTGIGGALTRDVLLGAVPPAALTDWRYLTAGLAPALLVQHFHPLLSRVESAIDLADAVWLGLFSVAGALKAVHLGVPPMTGVLLGVLTGIGGGVLRDVLVNRKPVVLTQEIYVFPALLGSLVVVVASVIGWSGAAAAVPGAVLCTAVRVLAIRRGWSGPMPVRHPDPSSG